MYQQRKGFEDLSRTGKLYRIANERRNNDLQTQQHIEYTTENVVFVSDVSTMICDDEPSNIFQNNPSYNLSNNQSNVYNFKYACENKNLDYLYGNDDSVEYCLKIWQ